jgi:hypothetical protein
MKQHHIYSKAYQGGVLFAILGKTYSPILKILGEIRASMSYYPRPKG